LLAYFEDKRMLTTFIQIEGPDYVSINVTASVKALPYFRNSDVSNAAETAIRTLFDFEKVDFKQTLYLSKIYEALENLDGVQSVFVSVFQKSGDAEAIAGDGLIQLVRNELPVLGVLKLSVTGGV
jgi:uncharacterized phage protein gp47/JayE